MSIIVTVVSILIALKFFSSKLIERVNLQAGRLFDSLMTKYLWSYVCVKEIKGTKLQWTEQLLNTNGLRQVRNEMKDKVEM